MTHENIFGSQSRAKVMQYKVELNSVKEEGGMSNADFVQKVQTHDSRLESTGCYIGEED